MPKPIDVLGGNGRRAVRPFRFFSKTFCNLSLKPPLQALAPGGTLVSSKAEYFPGVRHSSGAQGTGFGKGEMPFTAFQG